MEDNDIVELSLISLPKGHLVKLQAQKKEFLDITDHKAVLEETLKRHSCMTKDDMITINYANRVFA